MIADMGINQDMGSMKEKKSDLVSINLFVHDGDDVIHNRYRQQYARYADTAGRNGSNASYDAELCLWRQGRRSDEYDHVCDSGSIHLWFDG